MPSPYYYGNSGGYGVTRSDWQDYPNVTTPITRTQLNQIDQAIADLKKLSFNVKDYGAVGDGTTNDTTAVTAAQTAANAAGGVVYAPPGTYNCTTLAATSMTAKYTGPGVIKNSDTNKRAPMFSQISAPPASLGNLGGGVVTAFNGDLSKVQLAIEHRITGATTLSQPSTGYVETPEAAPIFAYMYNESGWNQQTGGSNGRTGVSAMYLRSYQAGQGDAGCINLGAVASGSRAGATSWVANPAAHLVNGGVNAVTNGVNMTATEFVLTDNGVDAAAGGHVLHFSRTNDTGALDTCWTGIRLMNEGSKAIDVGFMLQNTGSGNGAKVGLDLSAANFPTTGTWINAAITLKQDQRIYFEATGTDAGASVYRRPSSTGDSWITYNSADNSIRVVVDNQNVLQLYGNLAAIMQNVSLASGKTYQVNNTQVVTARQTGWTAATGTATRTTFATSTVTLSVLAEHVKALIDDLITHGLIGT